MASSSDAVSRTTRQSSTLATTMRPPLNDGQRGAAALDRVQTTASWELVVHSGACDQVGLLLEVELTVAKLLLVIDERPQRECLLLMVFVRSFK
ncbi:hypothetical protein ZEAMMB73_Zm00001d003808 [Zea mays]|uniref:Uncharacterized protein n=1 Tax=Zea mays TaxID=4577 RepID=A0A1D6EBP1_MAIZE|nr:hypothetical protein ZEAMMB73_Zm00001d003808 [Zea mays]